MRWGERQSEVEEKVYEAIEDIAEELKINIPFYPEVYWVGRNLSFEELKIHKKYEGHFHNFKERKISAYLNSPKIVLIEELKKEHIAEEAGHFLHFSNAKIKFSKRDKLNTLGLNIIIEMVGYFCSKLISPDRKNIFDEYPDIIHSKKECVTHLEKRFGEGFDEKYFGIYQQGYGLGDKLFNSYISGLISRRDIQRLIFNKMKSPIDSIEMFIGLKTNLVEYIKLKT